MKQSKQINNYETSKQWDEFLRTLYSVLSIYEYYHKIKKQYEKYGLLSVDNEYDYRSILKFLQNYIPSGNFTNTLLEKSQIEQINHVWNFAFNQKISIKCSNNGIVVTGVYISLKSLKNLEHTDLQCENEILENCDHIKIFAINVLFIDDDVNKYLLKVVKKRLPIIFFAPKWEIVGHRKIELDHFSILPSVSKQLKLLMDDIIKKKPNKNNEDILFLAARQILKRYTTVSDVQTSNDESGKKIDVKKILESLKKDIRDNNSTLWEIIFLNQTETLTPKVDKHGKHGFPGVPGDNGGFFFGFGDQFVHGNNLIITANGGRGGNGLPGEDGANATHARKLLKSKKCEKFCEKNRDFTCRQVECKDLGAFEPNQCIFTTELVQGGIAGNGGDGGAKGKGGLAGTIQLIEMSSSSNISMQAIPGEDGSDGHEGKGGQPGRNQVGMKIRCTYGFWRNTYWYEERRNRYSQFGTPGKSGILGNHQFNFPIENKFLFKADKAINEYKIFLRKNLDDWFLKKPITNFLQKIETNENVDKIYHLEGLVHDFRNMDFTLKAETYLSSFYVSMLNKVSKYAERTERFAENRKILTYLYKAALSGKLKLDDNVESHLIVDVKKFLERLKTQYDILKKKRERMLVFSTVQEHLYKYKSNIISKQDEARDAIEKKISPEIARITKTTTEGVNKLIEEIKDAQKNAQKETQKLENQKVQLEKHLRYMMYSLGLQAASDTMGMISDMMPVRRKREISNIEFPMLNENVRHYREKNVNRIKHIIEVVIKNCGSEKNSLRDRVLEIQDQLNKIDLDELAIEDIHKLEKELLKIVADANLESSGARKKRAPSPKVVLKGLQIVAKLGSLYCDYVIRSEKQEQEIELISDTIEKSYDKQSKLANLLVAIMDHLIPTIESLFKSIRDRKKEFASKNKIGLTMEKWEIMSAFENLHHALQEFKDMNFTSVEKIDHCLHSIKTAVNTMIDLFIQVQNYQEQSELAEFIAHTQLAAKNYQNKNENLIFADLELMVESNLLIHNYQTAFEAFKIMVFPFAHIYLNNLDLPEHMKLTGDIMTLVDDIGDNLVEIIRNLEYYMSVIKTDTPYLYRGEFNSRKISTEPFFIWKNEENNQEISELLAGNEVLMNANLMKSSLEYEAVKFNIIELNFKLKNEASQSKLDDLLKFFQVKLTHLGDSYFKYTDKTYLIQTKSLVIFYYFEKNLKDLHVHVGGSYDDLKEGDYMFSPYAMWKIQLMPIYKMKKNISFTDLKVYENEIDLELGGSAIYTMQKLDNQTIDMNVDFYYQSFQINKSMLVNVSESDSKNFKRDISKQMIFNGTVRGNLSSESSNWSSYLKFPHFNILPGAEAVARVDFNLIKLFDFKFNHSNQKIGVQPINIDSSIRNKIDTYVLQPNISQIEFDFCDDYPETLNLETKINYNYNLIFAQLIVGRKYGTNESLRNCVKVSPEYEKNLRVHKLSLEVLPMLKNSFQKKHEEDFLDYYDNASQWYQDLFRD